jgi:hypothetical protein
METAFLLLGFAGPIAGYVWADRRSPGSFPRLIAGAAFGGFTAGLLFAVASAILTPAQTTVSNLLPWIVAFTIGGAVLGILAVLARTLGSGLRS